MSKLILFLPVILMVVVLLRYKPTRKPMFHILLVCAVAFMGLLVVARL